MPPMAIRLVVRMAMRMAMITMETDTRWISDHSRRKQGNQPQRRREERGRVMPFQSLLVVMRRSSRNGIVAKKESVRSKHRGREEGALLTAEGIVAKKKVVRSMQLLRVDARGTPESMEIHLIELVAKKKVVRSRHRGREKDV